MSPREMVIAGRLGCAGSSRNRLPAALSLAAKLQTLHQWPRHGRINIPGKLRGGGEGGRLGGACILAQIMAGGGVVCRDTPSAPAGRYMGIALPGLHQWETP
jgi:hypothetical protein